MNLTTLTNRRRKIIRARGAGGVTLVELLAVIIIMTLLTAAAIPVIAPAMQNRQVREASRMVNGFLSGARNRAMQTGRPVGVVLDRMPGQPEVCVTLSYAEVPPPYAGDTLGSYVQMSGGNIQALTPIYDNNSPPNFLGSADIGWIGTIRAGDHIKFNYVGGTFQITGAVSTASGTPVPVQPDAQGYFTAAATPGPNCYWTLKPTTSGRVPITRVDGSPTKYQIFRAPIRSAAGSVQLPGTAVVDLTCSGFDNPGPNLVGGLAYTDPTSGGVYSLSLPWVSSLTFQPLPPTVPGLGIPMFANGGGDTSSVTITFAPSGAVDHVWCWQNPVIPFLAPTPPNPPHGNPIPTSFRPTQAIHLMVGRRELLPLPTALPAINQPNANGFQPFLNWQDPTNYWVTIQPQSGLVATTEVVQAQSFTVITGPPDQYGVYGELIQSRQLARQAHAMGGR